MGGSAANAPPASSKPRHAPKIARIVFPEVPARTLRGPGATADPFTPPPADRLLRAFRPPTTMLRPPSPTTKPSACARCSVTTSWIRAGGRRSTTCLVAIAAAIWADADGVGGADRRRPPVVLRPAGHQDPQTPRDAAFCAHAMAAARTMVVPDARGPGACQADNKCHRRTWLRLLRGRAVCSMPWIGGRHPCVMDGG